VINIRDEDLLISFGKHLAKTRQQKKLSQRKVALCAEIDVSQISRIERGLINPSLATLYVMAQAMDVPLGKLCTFEVKRM